MKTMTLKRILGLFVALAMVLTMLPAFSLRVEASNIVRIRSVVYNNGTPASATITFTYTGNTITYIDPMIGLSEGAYELDLDTQDAQNLPSGWSLTRNSDGSWTLVCNPLRYTGTLGVKPEEGTSVWIGVDVSDNETSCHDQLQVLIPAEGQSRTVQEGATSGHTLTVNYLLPIGPAYGNYQLASTTERHEAGESYSVTSPSYEAMGLRPNQATVSGTMPDHNLTVDVTYLKTYYAAVHYTLASGIQEPRGFSIISSREGLLDGAAYEFVSPRYEGLCADIKVVKGNIAGKDANVTVTYRTDSFDVIVYRRPAATLHGDALTAFMDQAEGYAHGGYKDGEFYSVENPNYYGFRPLEPVVEGYIDGANVEREVRYTDECTNPGGHSWVVTHDGSTHKEKCEHCGIEKAPVTAEVTYTPKEEVGGERPNGHYVNCGYCNAELREEACSAAVQPGNHGNCSGECKNCHAHFDYGGEHDYSGQKWTFSSDSQHKKTCNRCGYNDYQSCNSTSYSLP